MQPFDILRNLPSPLRLELGWYAVRNRNTTEVQEDSFEKRDQKEDELFSTGKWKSATLDRGFGRRIDPSVLGIKSLREALKSIILKQVKTTFPRLKKELKDHKKGIE